MAINRYTNQAVAMYNPMSLNELAFAPTFLRQRHDQTAEALSQLNTASGQYDVLSQYQPIASQLIDPLQKEIQALADKLATEGINKSQGIPQAMKLKSQYSNLFGQSGAIGQLQGATQQFRSRAEELKKQYEKNPLLQQYALSQLQPGEAILQDGKLQLGNFRDAQMVRDIAEEDILDRLNKAAGDLKPSDLARSGIQYTGKLGSFNDLYSIAQTQGVSKNRVDALLSSMISNEELLSIQQLAKATGQDPNTAIQNFLGKVQGVANANVTQTTSYRDFNVQDEMALYRAKQEEDNIPFIADGSLINVDVVNPFSGLVLSGNNISTEESKKQDQSYWKEKGFNVVNDAGGGFKVFSKSGDNRNPIYDSKNSNSANYNQRIKAFKQTKANNPELANLSDKEALEKINGYFNNLTKQYGKVEKVSLNNPNFVEATLARGLNSSVFTAEGKQANLSDLLEENGYEDYNDYIAKNKNAYQGYRKFGPNGKIVHEFVLSDGSPFFIEGEDNIKNISQETSEFNQMIIGGNTVSNFGDAVIQTPDNKFVPVKEVKINPIATGSEPYSLKLVPKDSRVNLDNTLRSRLAGKTPKQAQEVLSSLGYSPTEYKIESLSQINREENDLINSTLKYMRK